MLRRAFLFIAFALSVLLAGCRSEPPIHMVDGVKSLLATQPMSWAFSCSFDSEENKETVRKGFEYWDRMTKKKLFQENPQCDSINPEVRGILVRRSTVSGAQSSGKWTTLAYVQRYTAIDGLAGAELVLMPEWDDDDYARDYQAVPRHEVGHVLGFNHMPQKRCLMYPKISSHEGNVPPEDGWVKGACQEELDIFHAYYGN